MVALIGLAMTPPALPGSIFGEGWGVNIHFTDAPTAEYQKIAKVFRYARMDLFWHDVEKRKGVYDWSAYDRLVANLAKHKIRPYFILDYGNDVYQPGPPTQPESRAAFVKFATSAVQRYKGLGIVWEIWNEPNLGMFWQPTPNVNDYINLAKAVTKGIRAVSRDEILVGPATSGIDFAFLGKVFQSGLLKDWNAVSVHPYRSSHPETVIPDYLRLRQLIDSAPGGKGKPILSGEWGYSDLEMGRPLQAAYAVRQYLTNLSQGVNLSIYYDWKNDGLDPKEREHHFGTVELNLKDKPAYLAMSALHRELNGYRYEGRLIERSPAQMRLRFRSGDWTRDVTWTASATSASLPTVLPRAKTPALPALAPLTVGLAADTRAKLNARMRRQGYSALPAIPLSKDVSEGERLRFRARNGVTLETIYIMEDRWSVARIPAGPLPGQGGGLRIEKIAGPLATSLATIGAEKKRIEFSESSRTIFRSAPGDALTAPVSLSRNASRQSFPAVRMTGVPASDLVGGVGGDPKIRGEASVEDGVLHYDLGLGWKYTELNPARPIPIPADATTLGMWVKCSTPEVIYRMRFQDAGGQTWQPDAVDRVASSNGWEWVTFRLNDPGVGHWGGSKSHRIEHPIRLTTLFLVDPRGGNVRGTAEIYRPTFFIERR